MFKQLACSDILLKNKNHWSSSEELSAIYTQGIYKWQAINRRSFGSYNLCWNSIETSKKPIWTVPSFYYSFPSLPGIHCTLVSNTGRFFGGVSICVFSVDYGCFCCVNIAARFVEWRDNFTGEWEWDPNPVFPWWNYLGIR